ncbi:Immunogenic protein [Minicystis rosea]|nr:Immunogenic protein [Minicystis rosea]
MMTVMAVPQRPPRTKSRRILAAVTMIAALVLVVARLDLRPSLSHVKLRMLSGPREGNYHAMAESIALAARKRRGLIENVPSAGSMDNLERLAASAQRCDVQVALVQAGLPVPASPKLELHGRLHKAESIFFLGKNADAITDFAQLARLHIGIGPEGSGTARLVRQIFANPDLAGLGVDLSYHANAEQLALAERGELDLAVFVMDEDATFIASAVRDRGLQVAGFAHADVIARRSPFLRHGRIGAGQYDAVRLLPKTDREVLRVDTLVVGNGCAKRSQIMGLMTSLADVFPDLVRHNHDTPNTTGLDFAPASKSYFDAGAPELLDEYLPRVADVMPPSNWVHLIMGVSVLFNLMGVANRFVLWRIDAARVRAERDLGVCFGTTATLGDIARLTPAGDLLHPRVLREIDRVIADLEKLAARSRSLSLSVLVPMGGEMTYRYQEGLINETLAVLRAFRERWIAEESRALA